MTMANGGDELMMMRSLIDSHARSLVGFCCVLSESHAQQYVSASHCLWPVRVYGIPQINESTLPSIPPGRHVIVSIRFYHKMLMDMRVCVHDVWRGIVGPSHRFQRIKLNE